jgi:glycerophosphoryl diester phosphodiesterase
MPVVPRVRGLEWLTARPITHRGLHDGGRTRLENTRSAFDAAIRAGHPIECDVQLTADGEAVVFHDGTLDRVSQSTGPVIARTAKELATIPLKGTGDRIEPLSALLDLVDGKVPLVIEVKSRWNGDRRLAARSAEVLSGYGGPFALMSFDPVVLETLVDVAPAIPRGIVADRVASSYWRRVPVARQVALRHLAHWNDTAPHFISFDVDGFPWAPVGRARAAGVPVICWTVRSRQQASEALRHCDQITFEGFEP